MNVAELCLLLPLSADQRVGVLGDAKRLVEALTVDGLFVISLPLFRDQPYTNPETVEFKDSFDHVIIPEFSSDNLDSCLRRVGQFLKPGGWLLTGFHNSESLYRFLSKTNGVQKTLFSLRRCVRALKENGFQVAGCYGAYDKLEHPQDLIRLDNRFISGFFFRNIYIPNSGFMAWMLPVLILLSSVGLQRMLFRGIVIVARRK
jgi:hypothetical protein